MVSKVLVVLICAASILRLLFLETSPPGFYIDEAMGAANSLCYQQTWTDIFGKFGLFSKIDYGGFQSGPFLISGAIWSKVFGTGVFGFRSLTACFSILTLMGLYRLIYGLCGDRRSALLGTLLGAFLPWSFQFARIYWDSPMGTAFMVWALAVLFSPVQKPSRKADIKKWMTSAVLMALASYTYAPMRIQAVLLISFMPLLSLRARAWLIGSFGVMNLPVVPYYFDPEFTSRSRLLALTSDYSGNPYYGHDFWQLVGDYFNQVLMHLSPEFLLLQGDRNLRHSIQTFGMLDGVTYGGVLLALLFVLLGMLFQKLRPVVFSESSRALLLISGIGIFSGITPAALTWEGVPHAIRSMGAWPFFVTLSLTGWLFFFRYLPRTMPFVIALSTLFFGAYLRSYLVEYPIISAQWFDVDIVERIRSTGDFPASYHRLSRAYYRMHLKGDRCEDIQLEVR